MKGKRKLYHANMLRKYYSRDEGPLQVAAIAVLPDTEDGPPETGEIPTLPLKAEESVEDVNLDPECPEIHLPIMEACRRHPKALTDLPPRTTAAECEIVLDPETPVQARPYPIPFAERDAVKKELDEMLKLGVIERSNSPFCSHIVLIKKKSGQVRFCLDLRALNKQVVFDEDHPGHGRLICQIGQG